MIYTFLAISCYIFLRCFEIATAKRERKSLSVFFFIMSLLVAYVAIASVVGLASEGEVLFLPISWE